MYYSVSWQSDVWQILVAHPLFLSDVLNDVIGVTSSDISVTETITETEIIDPALTETETMLIYETEIIPKRK